MRVVSGRAQRERQEAGARRTVAYDGDEVRGLLPHERFLVWVQGDFGRVVLQGLQTTGLVDVEGDPTRAQALAAAYDVRPQLLGQAGVLQPFVPQARRPPAVE